MRLVGVVLGRRSATLVALRGSRDTPEVAHTRRVDRTPTTTLGACLKTLLTDLPDPFAKCVVRIAVSAGDFACADIDAVPEGIEKARVPQIAMALCEPRFLDTRVEEVVTDARVRGEQVFLHAMARAQMTELGAVAAARRMRLDLITSVPAVLASISQTGTTSVEFGQERIEVTRENGYISWRSCPVDGDRQNAQQLVMPVLGLELAVAPLPPEQAIAAAVALSDSGQLPNLLERARGIPGTPGSGRAVALRRVIFAAGALLCSLGLRFHVETTRLESELTLQAIAAREAWSRYLPDAVPQEGTLSDAMRRRVEVYGANPGRSTSVLAFWAQLARYMPDPNHIGMTLESLSLTEGTGRMVARVPVQPGDPLRYASRLESDIGRAPSITAQGDYETRRDTVHVRLRLEYEPTGWGEE